VKKIVLILLLALAPAAEAQGWLDSIRAKGGAKSADLIIGTVMTDALPAPDGSQSVILFSTSAGRGVHEVRFAPDAQRRVARDIRRGSTLVIFAQALGTDGVINATRWRADTDGNPARRDVLVDNAWVILAYALRERPALLERFARGHEGELAQVALELRLALENLGKVDVPLVQMAEADRPIDEIELPEPATCPPPPPRELACSAERTAITASLSLLEVVRALGATIEDRHHGDIGGLTAGAISQLQLGLR
jgi:hypothetical protein